MSISPPLLDVRDVGYMQDGIPLLMPVSLTLNAGEYLLLSGPSGSGKSTLLKIIASLTEPSQGAIAFRGQPVSALRPETYRQRVSYCFQSPVLFGETVYDNLALPWQIRQKKVQREALKQDLAKVDLPADMLDKKIDRLSGGEKQRVALLRNLQFLPDVLLLDEITSALDEENRQRINQLIAGLVKGSGVAVIAVSHHGKEISEAASVITLAQPERGSADGSA
ncbi:iron efflux ABC transporter ATP-binding subunit FetA [Pantoea sp. FN060301]|uniref:iron efflux ABC transporter ATP-binding subunit FetA n=1 Tax=Pantoea sp. FN060301 TaxID=3420380 RepID=UPI003D16DF9A